MVKPLIREPNLILHKKAVPVKEFSRDLQVLIDAMIETMHAAEGVGLAANQVGSPLDVLIASADGKRGKELVLINAEVKERKGRHRSPEGCLSLPGVNSDVTRAAEVIVTGLDRHGKQVAVEATGLMAKILQHETDHLDGRLFVDRLSVFKRRRLLKKYAEIAAEIKKVDL